MYTKWCRLTEHNDSPSMHSIFKYLRFSTNEEGILHRKVFSDGPSQVGHACLEWLAEVLLSAVPDKSKHC